MRRASQFLKRIRTRSMTVVLVSALAASCAAVGPKTIPRDQFDYGMAIANAWKEQLLFNIVRMRYVEAPVFVNVSSVINQYSLEGNVSLTAGANTAITGKDTVTLGGSGRFADRPTITYTPISGQKFARSLLTPIPLESLFALVQSGWPVDVILPLAVRSMNGLDNETASPKNRRQTDPRFTETLNVWNRLLQARVMGLRREGQGAEAKIVILQTGEGVTDQTRADLRFLYQSLRLDPEAKKYQLSYGLVPETNTEIRILTSSILEIINELAWRIDVPPEHTEEGRTGSTFHGSDTTKAPLIRVQYSETEPEESYVAVRVRDYWFYIDDRDVVSKRTFAIMQIMLSLTDSGEDARGPVVTITN